MSFSVSQEPEEARETCKVYRVAFLGSSEVGKTSIIDQFMSSEHADVFENDYRVNCLGDNISSR